MLLLYAIQLFEILIIHASIHWFSLWVYSGIFLGLLWDYFAITLGTLRDPSGLLCDLSGITMSVITMGSFLDHSWVTLQSPWEHSGRSLSNFIYCIAFLLYMLKELLYQGWKPNSYTFLSLFHFFLSFSTQCDIPDNPINGKALYTATAYKSVVSYECK